MGKRRTRTGTGSVVDDDGFDRSELISHICSGLDAGGVTAIIADEPFGVVSIVSAVVRRCASVGFEVHHVRFTSRSAENSFRRFNRVVSTLLKSSSGAAKVLLVVDDVPCLDDSLASRLGSLFDRLGASGARVLFVSPPSSEAMLEGVAVRLLFRGRDLALSEDALAAWCSERFVIGRASFFCSSFGIPALVRGLPGASYVFGSYLSGPAWNQASRQLLRISLDDSFMDEELKLRCAMAALGSGSFLDISELGVRCSLDLLSQIEEDAPQFGVSLQRNHFSLPPISPHIVAELLSAHCSRWPWLLRRALLLLAKQGDFYRCGALAEGCSSLVSPTEACARFPFELVDAGYYSLVASQMSETFGSPGSHELVSHALRVLGALPWGLVAREGSAHSGESGRLTADGSGAHVADARSLAVSRQSELLSACHGMRASAFASERLVDLAKGAPGDGAVTSKIACHLRVLISLFAGQPLMAFRELMVSRALRDLHDGASSVFSAVLEVDSGIVRKLVGDPLTREDEAAIGRSLSLLDVHAPQLVAIRARAGLEIAAFVADGRLMSSGVDRELVVCSTRKEHANLALSYFVAAMQSLSGDAFKKAYVQSKESSAFAGLARRADVGAWAAVASVLAGAGLREQDVVNDGLVSLSRLAGAQASRGATEASRRRGVGDTASAGRPAGGERTEEACGDACLFLNLFVRVWEGDARESDHSAALLRGTSPNEGLLLVVSLICAADRWHGRELVSRLPSHWRIRLRGKGRPERQTLPDELGRRAAELPAPQVGTCVQEAILTGSGGAGRAPVAEQSVIRVNVLGPLSVFCDGARMPESAWRRRHARSLLTMLALVPGHAVTRHDAATCFWPNADYARCREGLYTVLSSLRSTLALCGPGGFVMGETGRLWLNPSLVSCDIDEFESLERSITSSSTSDDEIVASCRRLEDTYRGGPEPVATDVNGMLAKRRREISRKYVDALLAGIAAALRMGDANQALWFADSAMAEDPNREDVVRMHEMATEAIG